MTDLRKNLILYYLLFSGLLIRLIFATFPGFHVDTDTFFAWSLRVVQTGFGNFYSPDVWTNYTPGMIYVFYVLGIVKNIFALEGEQFYFVLKLPSIFADIVLSFLIYKQLIKVSSKRIAFWGASLCLFNPVLIFNSAIWGAFDGLMTLFLFLSIKYLDQKKLVSSSIYFALSLLLKPQAIAIAPVFGLFVIKNFKLSNIIKLSVPALIAVILLSIPFFPKDPLFGFFNLFINMAQDYKGNSLFAYNTWGMFGFWVDDSEKLGFFSYRIWGLILLSVFWIYFYLLFFKRKLDAFTLSTLAFLAFFFLPTRVHERYLFSAIPFLILIALRFNSRVLITAGIILSTLHVVNLYFVYIYYNEFYLKLPKVLYIPGFYELLETQGKSLSLISTLLFALITFTISKIVIDKKHGH